MSMQTFRLLLGSTWRKRLRGVCWLWGYGHALFEFDNGYWVLDEVLFIEGGRCTQQMSADRMNALFIVNSKHTGGHELVASIFVFIYFIYWWPEEWFLQHGQVSSSCQPNSPTRWRWSHFWPWNSGSHCHMCSQTCTHEKQLVFYSVFYRLKLSGLACLLLLS